MYLCTALGIESPPDIESPRNSVLGDLPEYPKHIPLKRGLSDNSNLSLSPPTEHLLGTVDSLLFHRLRNGGIPVRKSKSVFSANVKNSLEFCRNNKPCNSCLLM